MSTCLLNLQATFEAEEREKVRVRQEAADAEQALWHEAMQLQGQAQEHEYQERKKRLLAEHKDAVRKGDLDAQRRIEQESIRKCAEVKTSL